MKLRLGMLLSSVAALLAAAGLFVSALGGSGYNYESRSKRDPFVPLTITDRSSLLKLEDVVSIIDVKLEGIASSPKGNLVAILNGEIVKEGDRFGEVEIKRVSEKSVTIVMDGKSYRKELIEDGGSKNGR